MALSFSDVSGNRCEALNKLGVVNFDVVTSGEEVEKVLCVDVQPFIVRAACSGNAINVDGEAKIGIVYLAKSGEIRSATTNGKISEQIDAECQSGVFFGEITEREVEVREIHGNTISLSFAYEVSGVLSYPENSRTISSCDGEYLESGTVDCDKTVFSYSAPFEVSHEFIVEKDVKETLGVTPFLKGECLRVGDEVISLEGKITCNVCFLTADKNVENATEEVSFSEEVQANGVGKEDRAQAIYKICVRNIEAFVDEVKGSTRFALTLAVMPQVIVYRDEKCTVGREVFSEQNELKIVVGSFTTDKFFGIKTANQKITQGINLSEDADKVLYTLFPKMRLSEGEKKDETLTVNGTLAISSLLLSDGKIKGFDYEVPFDAVINGIGENDKVYLFGYVRKWESGLKYKNELSVNAEVDIIAIVFTESVESIITEVEVGEEKKSGDGEIILYVAKGGESAISLAGELNLSPVEIERQNQGITYPLSEGQKIVVFRQKKHFGAG